MADLPPDMLPELFLAYREDLRKHLESLRQQVPGLSSSDSTGRTEAEKTAGLAEEALQHLEMEVRSLPPADKESLRPMVREYKNALGALRKDLRALSAEAQRLDLLNPARRHEKELHAMEESMERGERMLAGAQDEALKAEVVGQEIMGDLSRQRDVLHRARGNLGKLDDELDISNMALDDIMGAYRKNSRVVNLVLCLLVLAALTVVYMRS